MCGECFVITEDNTVYRPTFQLIYAREMFLLWAKVLQSRADVSIHICAGNVLVRGEGDGVCEGFQLIYVRGMFSCGHGDMTGLDGWGFNSYMCGECFLLGRAPRCYGHR